MEKPEIYGTLEVMAEKAAGNAKALVSLAKAMAAGRPERAAALASQALALAPETSVAQAAQTLLRDMVPEWHFTIVHDHIRNKAFEQALQRAVTPQSRVLDIGAGTGLLAMMAARAGAAEVVTCEKNPAVAAGAARVLAANGLVDRIRLVESHSSEIDPERDLGGPIDVLVSEIVSNNIVGQGCLPVMEQAARWLKPDGRMIPAAATAKVALAWSEAANKRRMGTIEGFDLSPFNTLEGAAQRHRVGDPGLAIRSSVADLMHFNFRSGGPFPPGEERTTVIADGGTANGILQWMHLQMDDQITYENRPGPGAKSCWSALFYPFPEALQCDPGQTVEIIGAHDRNTLNIWVA